jgi:hypothetical protein
MQMIHKYRYVFEEKLHKNKGRVRDSSTAAEEIKRYGNSKQVHHSTHVS